MKFMKIFLLAIFFFIIGILNLDIRIDGAYLNGIPFEAEENCGGLPCLMYSRPGQTCKDGVLNNVQDIYWNDKYIYAIDTKTYPSPISFIVTYNKSDYGNRPYVVSDTLNESQANQILKSIHADLSKMHHINIKSDEFAITFYLKIIILFVGCILLSHLFFLCYKKCFNSFSYNSPQFLDNSKN